MGSGGATTDLVFDVTGYYTADATGLRYVPLTAATLLDTRTGTGLTGKFSAERVAALKERVQADGLSLDDELCFIDEGHSGSVLVRPALERLRDTAYAGGIDRLYVHSPACGQRPRAPRG